MNLVQGYLAPALLRAEPEGAQQAEENVQHQEGHTRTEELCVTAPRLLETATDVRKAAYVRYVDIADAELFLAVRPQIVYKIAVFISFDTDTQFVEHSDETGMLVQKRSQIVAHRVTPFCLLIVVVTHGL